MIPPCETIVVLVLRANRSRSLVKSFQQKLDDERAFRPGPTVEECLHYLGHSGVSLDGGNTVYGFQPDSTGVPFWQLLSRLKSGDRVQGVVRDDTPVFKSAQSKGNTTYSFEIIFPLARYHDFQVVLDAERQKSQYYYGFPNGDGDCNCVTWLERLGLPLLSGRMSEIASVIGTAHSSRRRFGLCK
jgi:hypothetical protein